MKHFPIVAGDPAEELRATQIIALTLGNVASRVGQTTNGCSRIVVPPLLMAAAGALSLASTGGLHTPLAVLALSARNTFEIWLRLKHVLASEANCQEWREENLEDQLQIYKSILTLPGNDSAKDTIRDEMRRLTSVAADRGISPGRRPLSAHELAKRTGDQEDYAAFYRLYSKLVHPSSWAVNSPTATKTPMYRQALVVNSQTYGWRVLQLVETHFGLSVDESHDAALEQMPKTPQQVVH